MASSSIKISQISEDLSISAKEITAIFKNDLGIDKKSGAAASATGEEFEILINKLTLNHQIKDLDSYLAKKNTISVIDERPKAAPEKKSEPKPAAVHTEKPAEQKEVKSTPVQQSAPAQQNTAQTQQRPAVPNARQPQQRDARPQQQKPMGGRNDRQAGADGRPQRQNAPQQRDGKYQKYSDSTSFDPFAKRRESMNRQAEGFKKFDGNRRPDSQNAPARQESPKASNVIKPAQLAALAKQKMAEEKAKNAAAAVAAKPAPAAPKKDEKRAQKQQFKTITPNKSTDDVRGGVNIGTEFASEAATKTRVVDMRTSDVNLSKYDDRYNDQFFAIANGVDSKAQKQKLKKQDNKGQNVKSAKDKERAAQEKIKRLEAEKARKKQLEITVPDEITVGELAVRLKKTSAEVIKKLLMMGEMKMINDVVDFGTAELIADEFGAKVTKEIIVTKEEILFTEAEDKDEDLIERAPVVCVMGHVDHGKTSILDAIRHTNVTRGEAGGITQAIGAYRVRANDKDITFLDTPGHEAFTAMRMRGAKSTDIAILVVAADDGVMPQTVEAISHAKAAGIDIIVAINKMDKPQANPDNVLNQLTQYELVPEEWGGDVICVPCSAHTKMGIDSLLESVLLVAEVKELKANPQKRAKGLVIESKLDKGRGPVATVLVQNGTLHQGDYVIVGNAVGRVRAMVDDKGKTVKVAGPSVPVEIIGLDDVPQAGDELNAVEDERMARQLAEERREKQRQEILTANSRVNLDELFSQISEGVKSLNIVVKADVAGSAEAVKASLVKLTNEEVKVSVIHSAVGGITENDVMLAAASNAIIVGFNVRPDKKALDSAERNGVDIRTHRIIYEIIDEIEAAMKGMLSPTFKEALLGHAEVRQTIRVPNVGTIAGCYVKDGKITRQSQIRVIRDGIVIFEDKISSLKRFKDDVREVADGYECGVGLEKFNDIKEGDMLEAFIMEEVEKK